MSSDKPLSDAEKRATRKALAAGDFDEALRLTPDSVMEKLFDSDRSSAHDFFDDDGMFPAGWKPLTPKQLAAWIRRSIK